MSSVGDWVEITFYSRFCGLCMHTIHNIIITMNSIFFFLCCFSFAALLTLLRNNNKTKLCIWFYSIKIVLNDWRHSAMLSSTANAIIKHTFLSVCCGYISYIKNAHINVRWWLFVEGSWNTIKEKGRWKINTDLLLN